ncbi:bromodomain-containing protein [Anaeramoeba flamelloides]|uniref:Bromodomain-containing protein n=1 Tax=Anaeramoeba flamelloides TaxID=1746091 RepID=A0AAV7ZS22_9EUKA|nr:bromodomain-containing protein [Anaeramoeba flamelloides]
MDNSNQPSSPEELLNFFTSHELIHPFAQSIREIIEAFPLYTTEIEQPIDLITISDNLRSGKYTAMNDLAVDLQLMFKNAMVFNSPELEVYKAAETLLGILEEKITPKKKNSPVYKPKSSSDEEYEPNLKKISSRRITRSASTQFEITDRSLEPNLRTNKSDGEDDDDDFVLSKNRKRNKSKLSREQNVNRHRKRRHKKSKRKRRDRKRRHRHRHKKKKKNPKKQEKEIEEESIELEEKVKVPLQEIKRDLKAIERIGIDYKIGNKSHYVYQAHEYAENLAFDLFSILHNIDFEKKDAIKQKKKKKRSNNAQKSKLMEAEIQENSNNNDDDDINKSANVAMDINNSSLLIETISQSNIKSKIKKKSKTQKNTKKQLNAYPILTCGKMRIEKNNNYQIGKVPFYIPESSFQNKLHSNLENEIKNLKSNLDLQKTQFEQGIINGENSVSSSPVIDQKLGLNEIVSLAPEIPQLNSKGLGEIFGIIMEDNPSLAGENNIEIDLASISDNSIKKIKRYLMKRKKTIFD